MLRVLKPGGLGVFCEADMGCSLNLLCVDDHMVHIFMKKNEFIAKMCSNPRAASHTYACLRGHRAVRSVTMQAFSCVLSSPAALSGDLTMDQQFLQKMVELNMIEQSDVSYYLEQSQNGVVPIVMLGPFEIVFNKVLEDM